MPIYTYECPTCKKEKEVDHSINSEPIINCEFCNSRMKRIIKHAPAFKINGYFTSATGYSKDPEYMKAVEQEKKRIRRKG